MLKRKLHTIPDFVLKALKQNNLMASYHNRPPYQQNDYIGWINRAVQMETKLKRMNQMLAELKSGDRYMKMKYSAKT